MLHLDVDRVPPISHIPSTAANELPTVIGDATFLQIFCHSIPFGFRLIVEPAMRSDPRISADLSCLLRFFIRKSDVFLVSSRLVSREREKKRQREREKDYERDSVYKVFFINIYEAILKHNLC